MILFHVTCNFYHEGFIPLKTVKKVNVIPALLSVLLGLLFLAGSTGITVITHSCAHCDDHSIKAGILVPPVAPDDDCCEFATVEDNTEKTCSLEGECCHFRIDRLKLVNYAHPDKTDVPAPEKAPYQTITFRYLPIPGPLRTDFAIHNKHGGRFLVTSHCQLIS